MLRSCPMWGIFSLYSIDTDTKDRQFNISSQPHLLGVMLLKVCQYVFPDQVKPSTNAGTDINYIPVPEFFTGAKCNEQILIEAKCMTCLIG